MGWHSAASSRSSPSCATPSRIARARRQHQGFEKMVATVMHIANGSAVQGSTTSLSVSMSLAACGGGLPERELEKLKAETERLGKDLSLSLSSWTDRRGSANAVSRSHAPAKSSARRVALHHHRCVRPPRLHQEHDRRCIAGGCCFTMVPADGNFTTERRSRRATSSRRDPGPYSSAFPFDQFVGCLANRNRSE